MTLFSDVDPQLGVGGRDAAPGPRRTTSSGALMNFFTTGLLPRAARAGAVRRVRSAGGEHRAVEERRPATRADELGQQVDRQLVPVDRAAEAIC